MTRREREPPTSDSGSEEVSRELLRLRDEPDRSRRCGGPELVPEEPCGSASRAGASPAQGAPGEREASEYLEWCLAHPTFHPDLVKEVTRKGGGLLLAAGTVAAAAEQLRLARERRIGNPLAGVLSPELQDTLEADHGAYLAAMASQGVPTRRTQPRRREVANPHASARDHALEMFEKAWKDTAYGVVLWATPASEET